MKSLEDSHFPAVRRHRLSFDSLEDRDEFHNDYDLDEQERVRTLHDLMMQIDAAPNPHRGSKAVKCALWDAKTLESKHKKWVSAGRDWRELVNKSKYPTAREPRLPEAFRDLIRSMFSANQRVNKAPYRKIIRQWKQWLHTGRAEYAVPGYEVCPLPGSNSRHPRGWSFKNLNRSAPDPADREMARIGLAAALAYLPHIHGTREGARWLEYVSGDDMFLNRKTCVPGFRDPCRVVQFGMMDYAASYYLEGFIQRPILPRADGTTEQLKRRDFLWCVAMMLERYGYPLDYVMHLILERGTATLSKAEARFLYEISEGRIICGYSTMEGELVAAWDERKTGNSNAKPWHESTHNLLQNEEGDLAGQMGKDRDHTPAALYGRERAAQALSDIEMRLPLGERLRLRKPFPGLQECYAQTLERVRWIHQAQDHECEGFAQVLDWKPRATPMLPLPESELERWIEGNPHVAAAIAADVDALERYVEFFPRVETRAERMRRLSEGTRFARLPSGVYRTFYQDLHETRRIEADGSFTFQRDKRTYRFEPPTPAEALRPGTEVTGFFRPDGSAIHLFAGEREFLLTWPEVKAHRRDDTAGKQLDHARKRSFIEATASRVRKDFAVEIEQARDDARHNLAVAAENNLLDTFVPPVSDTAALVQDGCTRTAAAVLEVATVREQTARQQKADATRDDRAAQQARQQARAAAAERARQLQS